MEILDFKLGGMPVWLILIAAGLLYNARYVYREWRKDRDMAREVDEARRRFEAEHD